MLAPHAGQCEPGKATDSPRGSRWMRTLTKLPATRPNRNTAIPPTAPYSRKSELTASLGSGPAAHDRLALRRKKEDRQEGRGGDRGADPDRERPVSKSHAVRSRREGDGAEQAVRPKDFEPLPALLGDPPGVVEVRDDQHAGSVGRYLGDDALGAIFGETGDEEGRGRSGWRARRGFPVEEHLPPEVDLPGAHPP